LFVCLFVLGTENRVNKASQEGALQSRLKCKDTGDSMAKNPNTQNSAVWPKFRAGPQFAWQNPCLRPMIMEDAFVGNRLLSLSMVTAACPAQ
jgi:hypothetical protein